MAWAAPQDWMCEPVVLAGGRGPGGIQFVGTNLSVREHLRRTVENLVELRSLAPEVPFVPVLQGWTHGDYLDCAELYARAGVDLRAEPVVGVGTMCRRQATLRGSPHPARPRLRQLSPARVRLQDGGIAGRRRCRRVGRLDRVERPVESRAASARSHAQALQQLPRGGAPLVRGPRRDARPQRRAPGGGVSAGGTVELAPARRAPGPRRARRSTARASTAATVAAPPGELAAESRPIAWARQLTLALFPVPARPPLVVSCGLGVDSVSMLIGMRARGIVPDLILFADTGDEKPETYAYLPILQAWLAANGFPPVTVVRLGTVHGDLGVYSTLYENCYAERNVMPSAVAAPASLPENPRLDAREHVASTLHDIAIPRGASILARRPRAEGPGNARASAGVKAPRSGAHRAAAGGAGDPNAGGSTRGGAIRAASV